MDAVTHIKHLVECNCLLPQFKHSTPPRWHHFVVFSEINVNGDVIPSFAQCNNCGVIHKVIEVGISSLLKRDSLVSLPITQELLENLPDKLQKDLEKYKPDLPTLQEITWVFERKAWGGKPILLSKDAVDGMVVGKTLSLFGETLWKINSFQEEEE